jgi:PAS domain S-box-containing protein
MSEKTMPPEFEFRIFDAARAELLATGIDRFSIGGVARRAGVDPHVIEAQWHDRRVLLMDLMLTRTAESRWTRDTGSIHTDLDALAALAAELSQTPAGRAMFRRVLPGGDDVDLAEIVSDLWDARFRDAAEILKRAAGRGQLRDGVDPEEAIRMFAAAFYYDVIFADSAVRPEYAEQVLDVFLHGILGASGRDRPWPEMSNPPTTAARAGSAADQAVEAARRAVVLMRLWTDALPDPVVLYEAVRDSQGQIVDFICRDLNRPACDEVGLTRNDLVGRSAMATLPHFASSGLLEQYANCVEQRTSVVLSDFGYQHFDQQRRLDLQVTSAGADLITVTWRDGTERFEAAQRDQRYRQLIDLSAVPAGLTMADGRIVAANQAMATLMGYDLDTLMTMNWQDLTAPEILQAEIDAVAEMLTGRRDTYRTVKQYVRADGKRILGDLSLSCIRRPDGEVEFLITQVIDVGRYFDGEARPAQAGVDSEA